MARMLIDANIFLELELSQAKSEDCKAFLYNVARGKLKAIVTDFTLDSVALAMESRGSSAKDIRKFFTSLLFYKGLQLYNLDLKGRILATEKMEKEKLDFDDATSIAVMKRLKINEIVSFDRDFDKVQGISRIEPGAAISRS